MNVVHPTLIQIAEVVGAVALIWLSTMAVGLACWAGEGTCEPAKGEWADGMHFRTDLPPQRVSTTVLLPEDY